VKWQGGENYPSPFDNRTIKSKRRWKEHVARMWELRNAGKMLVAKLKRRDHLID
jgi:hypothetical protein